MRLKTLTTRALVVATALAAAFVVAPATTAQAACSFSISSLSWSPASVSNAVDSTVTMTLKATAGFSSIGVDVGPLGFAKQLKPVSGQAGTYRGTLGVTRGTAPGQYGLTSVVTANSQCFLASFSAGYEQAQLEAMGLPELTVTGAAADTQAPVVASFTGGSGPYPATAGSSIPVSMRVTDDVSGVASVTVSATGDEDSSLPQPFNQSRSSSVALTRTGGTDLDGTWTGSLPLVAGTQQPFTYYLTVTDRVGHLFQGPPPTGSATGFRTATTAAPAAPTGVKAVTAYQPGVIGDINIRGGWYVGVTWNPPAAGTPGATDYRITTTGSCAGAAASFWSTTSARVYPPAHGVCKVTVYAHNGVGTSAGASASALF
ncbi:hypothetical protein ACIB24_05505 [Spongisporangium articulatum]|uniref:Fibronectin type-III domain-containing protein n=1 Tax=Spongisporangium articulatum TaxID=3362603 RepID=A0ABW8AJH2_9ACTN